MTTAEGNESQEGEVTLDEAMKALGRLGMLSYQQRQMARDGEIKTLLEQMISGVHASEAFSWFIVIGCGSYAAIGLFTEGSHWVCGAIAVLTVAQILSKRKRIREVTNVVRSYAATLPPVEESDESLLRNELRSSHLLTYQQIQLLKAGRVRAVARDVVAQLRSNGFMSGITMGVICLSQIIIIAPDAAANGELSSLYGIVRSFGHLGLMSANLVFVQWTQRDRRRKLEQLLNEHPPDTAAEAAGAEIESDHDSPYRSPQFR